MDIILHCSGHSMYWKRLYASEAHTLGFTHVTPVTTVPEFLLPRAYPAGAPLVYFADPKEGATDICKAARGYRSSGFRGALFAVGSRNWTRLNGGRRYQWGNEVGDPMDRHYGGWQWYDRSGNPVTVPDPNCPWAECTDLNLYYFCHNLDPGCQYFAAALKKSKPFTIEEWQQCACLHAETFHKFDGLYHPTEQWSSWNKEGMRARNWLEFICHPGRFGIPIFDDPLVQKAWTNVVEGLEEKINAACGHGADAMHLRELHDFYVMEYAPLIRKYIEPYMYAHGSLRPLEEFAPFFHPTLRPPSSPPMPRRDERTTDSPTISASDTLPMVSLLVLDDERATRERWREFGLDPNNGCSGRAVYVETNETDNWQEAMSKLDEPGVLVLIDMLWPGDATVHGPGDRLPRGEELIRHAFKRGWKVVIPMTGDRKLRLSDTLKGQLPGWEPQFLFKPDLAQLSVTEMRERLSWFWEGYVRSAMADGSRGVP